MFDLSFELPRRRGAGRALYVALRDAMLSGRLRPGERLPSTRELASSLQLSRNTVATVYEHLASEGFTASRVGAGTFVARVPASCQPTAAAAQMPLELSDWARHLPVDTHIVEDRQQRLDFRPGAPSPELARALMMRLHRQLRCFADRDWIRASGSDPRGLVELRNHWTNLLRVSRGV